MTQQQLITYRFPVVRDGRVIGGVSWSHEDGYIAWDWTGEALGEARCVTDAVAMVKEVYRLHLARERRLLLHQQAYRMTWHLYLAELAALDAVARAADDVPAAERLRRLRAVTARALARQERRQAALSIISRGQR